jgi:hypothetical protein
VKQHTRIYNRWQGYTVADCDCRYCVHYAGQNSPCPLRVCCCAGERAEAARRERSAAAGNAAHRPVRKDAA